MRVDRVLPGLLQNKENSSKKEERRLDRDKIGSGKSSDYIHCWLLVTKDTTYFTFLFCNVYSPASRYLGSTEIFCSVGDYLYLFKSRKFTQKIQI